MLFRNVEIFCDVAARRSFSKAAEAHHVSQPVASKAVQDLEEHLDVQLVDRSKRPLELTPAGKLYFEGCRKLLEGFRRVEDRIQNMKDKISGRVRVAAIYSVGLLQMEGCVNRYQELYPDVELQLHYLHPDEVYQRITQDEADLGLVSFPKDGGEISAIPWQQQQMVLVVPKDHELANQPEICVEQLCGLDFVAFTNELKIRRQTDRWFKEEKITVRVTHEFDNVENIKRAVEIGAGVALLPAPSVRREVSIGTLTTVELEGMNWQRPLGIVHRRNHNLTTAASKFVELLLGEEAEAVSSKEENIAVA